MGVFVTSAVLLALASAGAQETGNLRGYLRLPPGVQVSSEELAKAVLELDGRALDVRFAPDLELSLDGLSQGEHTLEVRIPEFEALVRSFAVRAGESTVLELPLVLGIVLEGRITDSNGETLAGALVTATSTSRSGRWVHTVPAPHGAFRIAGIPAGELSLRARCVGYSDAALELGLVPASGLRDGLVLRLAGEALLSGVVLDASGRPCSGAAVLLESEIGARALASTRTATDGRFAFPGLGPGPFHVEARAQGLDGMLVRSARGVKPGPSLELEVVPTAAVQVVVRGKGPRDSTSCVVRDATGRLAWHEFQIENVLPHVRSFETTTGHRVYGLEPGVYGLEVKSEDFARAAWVRVEVRAGEEKKLDVQLRPATFLVVQALEDGLEVPSWLTVEAANGLRQQVGHGVCVRSGTTELATLPPGEYRLIAERGERRGEAQIVLGGEPEREVRIELE